MSRATARERWSSRPLAAIFDSMHAAGLSIYGTLAVIASVFLKEVPIRAHTPAERRQVADAEQREEAPSFGG